MLGIVPVIALIISLPAGHSCKIVLELGRRTNWIKHCFGLSI